MKKTNLYFLTIISFILFIILLFPLPGICFEGNIIVEWDKTFGGSDNDWARSLIQTTDGGYAVAGDIRVEVYSVFSVIKLNSKGNKDWEKTFSGSDKDYAYSLIQTTDGGYAVAGKTDYFFVGRTVFYIRMESGGEREC